MPAAKKKASEKAPTISPEREREVRGTAPAPPTQEERAAVTHKDIVFSLRRVVRKAITSSALPLDEAKAAVSDEIEEL